MLSTAVFAPQSNEELQGAVDACVELALPSSIVTTPPEGSIAVTSHFGAVVACCMYVHFSICSMHQLSENNSNAGEPYKCVPLFPLVEEEQKKKPHIHGIFFADFDCTVAQVNCVTAMRVHSINTVNQQRTCLAHLSASYVQHHVSATHRPPKLYRR